MTPHEAEAFVQELYEKRPGKHLVQFRRFDAGSVDEPWSAEPGPYRRKYPSDELWDNGKYAEKTGWNLPNDCKLVFGLGSIYAFTDCSTEQVLYLGRAGETPAQYRVATEIGKAERGTALTFPRHCWNDGRSSPTETEIIRAGRFYVVFIVNVTPWGSFDDPFCKRPGSTGICPYVEISADLESWVMQRGDRPPLNRRDECRRRLNVEAPWGAPALTS